MDITEKNGQPSMEEILASIRRIIADEPAGAPLGIELNPKTMPAASMQPYHPLDETADFELPAIFRNGSTQSPEKPALLGRLTDAIRGATSSAPETRPVRADEFYAAAPDNGPANGRGGESHVRQAPTLSSLRPARPEPFPSDQGQGESASGDSANSVPGSTAAAAAPATASSGWKFGRASPPPKAVEEEISRVMSPFKDTRFKQMAVSADAQTASPIPAPVQSAHLQEPMASPPRAVDFSAIIPAHMDFPGIPHVEQHPVASASPAPAEQALPAHPWSGSETIVPLPASPLVQGYVPPVYDEPYPTYRPSPPPPPQGSSAHEGAPTGTIEDTTAELLRPMLRQWLADNMPRMVEKALHIEVAESVKTGKKLPN